LRIYFLHEGEYDRGLSHDPIQRVKESSDNPKLRTTSLYKGGYDRGLSPEHIQEEQEEKL